MMRFRALPVRVAAAALLAAIAVAVLHQHPTWHDSDRAACPAAIWHAGAILHADAAPILAFAPPLWFINLPRPSALISEPAVLPWSSRAPPLPS